jgi:hypothetical protein
METRIFHRSACDPTKYHMLAQRERRCGHRSPLLRIQRSSVRKVTRLHRSAVFGKSHSHRRCRNGNRGRRFSFAATRSGAASAFGSEVHWIDRVTRVLGNGAVYTSVKSTFGVNAIQAKGGQMDKKFRKTRTTDLIDGLEHASKALEGPETCPEALQET